MLSKEMHTEKRTIELVMEEVAGNYPNNMSQAEITEHFGLHPVYFSRMFKQQTGRNYKDFITELRINHIKQMIQNEPELSLQEMAEKCGLSDKTYLCELFKKHTGMTIGEYQA